MNGELERLRALSEAASPDWTVAELGIARMVRERQRGPQIGNFILDEDAEFAVAACGYVRDLLARDSAGAGLDVELVEAALIAVDQRIVDAFPTEAAELIDQDPAARREYAVAIATEFARLAARQPVEGSEK